MGFDAWIFGVIMVVGAVLVASAGALAVRRAVAVGTLKSNHEVAGYLLSVVGTLYSVLLGLIVVDTQGKYQEARAMSQQEADSCLDMFHLAYGLPSKERIMLHHKLQEYLDVLVAQEWESHTSEGSFVDFAKTPFRDIWWELTDFEPQTNKEQSVYEQLLDEMQKLSDGRRYRMQISKTSLPPVMWGVLIAGATLTVFFTYLFEVENTKAQVLMTALVALSLALNILLVALFNNPYKGYMRIQAYQFEYDRKVMSELLKIRADK
ncbi:MAG: DUF4239 domain-containing protein [Candidatus Obscuribacterales bacterium]|nr:DUF4239 domain-containing protein [Candidatus Obscuribacterales bacterium]